ncbi:MAG: glycoside hydrolase family 3 C-terminal domain-containing protein, partial [Candidatus Korobacteraceae bacterium]
AAVEAVKAGNDVLLSFSELESSYKGLLQAVRSGEIPESRIDQSVLKILRAKASVGLNQATQVDIDAVNRIVARPESLALAQEIADRAVTLVRDNHQVLPLVATVAGTKAPQNAYHSAAENCQQTVVLIFTDDSRYDDGRVLEHQTHLRIPDAKVFYIDARNAAGVQAPVMDAVAAAQKVVVAVYLSPLGGAQTNKTALQNEPAAVLERVLQSAAPKTVVVAMGNPYIATQFPAIQTYLCTFSDAQVSEMSAVKAMFGEIPMTGHLPVTIPGIAERGAGLKGAEPDSSGGPQ